MWGLSYLSVDEEIDSSIPSIAAKADYSQPLVTWTKSMASRRPFATAISASLSFPDIEDHGMQSKNTPHASEVAALFCAALMASRSLRIFVSS